jgi:hypothetical protein
VTPAVRFEIEADAEYRLAGRWYDEQRAGLGAEFFDAVDATLDRIVRMPHAGARVPRVRADLPVRRAPVRRFPYAIARFASIVSDGKYTDRPTQWVGASFPLRFTVVPFAFVPGL